jgi:hypothetical protein
MFQLVGQTRLVPTRGELIGRITDIVVSETMVLVADGIEANVKSFTRDGRHARTFGRAGDGPGEFREPTGLVLLPPRGIPSLATGERVAVLDRKRAKVSLWSLEGEEIVSWPHNTLIASSISLSSSGNDILVFGSSIDRDRNTGERWVIHVFSLDGKLIRKLGAAPVPTHPGEGTFRIYIGDRVGRTSMFTHSSTNTVWEVRSDTSLTVKAGQDFYMAWDWEGKPEGQGAAERDWMARQIWTTTLFALDSIRYVVGLGYPNPPERAYRYRYVVMEAGQGEVAATNNVAVRLLFGQNDTVWGVNELEDGSALLLEYKFVPEVQ